MEKRWTQESILRLQSLQALWCSQLWALFSIVSVTQRWVSQISVLRHSCLWPLAEEGCPPEIRCVVDNQVIWSGEAGLGTRASKFASGMQVAHIWLCWTLWLTWVSSLVILRFSSPVGALICSIYSLHMGIMVMMLWVLSVGTPLFMSYWQSNDESLLAGPATGCTSA